MVLPDTATYTPLIQTTGSQMATFTALAYISAGLFARESLALAPYMIPSVLIGVPVGAFVIRHIRTETFRRVCMSFDAWVVGFGLSTLLRGLHIVDGSPAFLVLAAVVLVDGWLLYRFFLESHPDVSRSFAGA